MIYANFNGEKIKATKKAIGYCNQCNQQLIPVCGNEMIHHWRHRADINCNYKPETPWHREMKVLFDKEFVEIKKDNHIADVLLPNDTCIEFQNSTIDPFSMKQRNDNYKRIVWVFNLNKQYDNGQVEIRLHDQFFNEDPNVVKATIHYKRPKKYIKHGLPNLYLFFNDNKFFFVHTISSDYIFNDHTGYNELHYNMLCTLINIKNFKDLMINFDKKFEVKKVTTQLKMKL